MARRPFTFAIAFALCGCSGEVHEHLPSSWDDDATPATASGSPTVRFDVIQSDIDALTCSNMGCHGSGLGNFRLVKEAKDADLTANYEAVKARAANGELSKLLIKATGGEGHVGGTRMSKQDAIYTRWVTWIREGTPR